MSMWGFRAQQGEKETLFLGRCGNNRLLEIADEAGNIYVFETMTGTIEILTVYMGFMIMESSNKNRLRQEIWTATNNRK